MKNFLVLGVLLPVMFLAGCGDSATSGDGPFAGRIEFTPDIAKATTSGGEVDVALAIELEVFADETPRKVIIDTGSVYYFLASPDNSKDLPCSSPETFSYGSGTSVFCPEEAIVDVKTTEGSYAPLRNQALKMGRSHFEDWQQTLAIMGLAANLVGENRKSMASMMQQLKPDFLSFSFPDGLTQKGFLQFEELPDDAAAGFPSIPLVDPGPSEYGYTALPLRLEYYSSGKLHTTLSNTEEGVFLETATSIDRVADEFRTFFDTGTTVPLLMANAVSLLSDQVANAVIEPERSAADYDRVLVFFEGEAGEEVVVDSGDLAFWIDNSPFAKVPTKAAIPSDAQALVLVVGLNFLGRFDFQFDFDGGVATSITLVDRPASARD